MSRYDDLSDAARQMLDDYDELGLATIAARQRATLDRVREYAETTDDDGPTTREQVLRLLDTPAP